jgi:HlyD family secretion protein
MRTLVSRSIMAATVAILLAAGGYYWMQSRSAEAEIRFRTAKIDRGPLAATVVASGTLNAVTTVQVGSQISGLLKDIYADFNTTVKRNQILARIDPATFELRVNQTRADLDAARSAVAVQRSGLTAQQAELARVRFTLADAQRDFERKRMLVERKFISPADLEKATSLVDATREQVRAVEAQIKVGEAQIDSALAAVKQREALLRQAEVDLERTIIRAPVDGTVILKNVDAGQTVAASLQAPVLFTIARDLRDMQVEAAIDEADVGRLRVGQQVSFTVDAFPRRSFSGAITVIRKSPQTIQNVVSYIVVISASNPDLSLLPGMTANVRITVAQRDRVLRVPNAALRFRPPGTDARPAGETAAEAPAAPQQAGGAAVQQFRQRLETELKLDAAQKAKLDEIFSEMRMKMGKLRDLPEAQRRAQAERARAEMRTRVEGILNAGQKPVYERLLGELGTRGVSSAGRVWMLRDGRPHAVPVRLGLTDGSSTEIVPDGDTPQEGADVIIGIADQKQESRESTQPRLRLF